MFTKMKGDLESKMVFHQKPYLHFVTDVTAPNLIITVMSLWQMTAYSLISLVGLLTDFWMRLPSGVKNVSSYFDSPVRHMMAYALSL